MYNSRMPIQWIDHNQKKILFIDASNLMNDHVALNAKLEAVITVLKKEPTNSVLALADLRNTYLNNNALMTLMRNAPFATPYFFKSALVIEPNYTRGVLLDSFKMVIKRVPKRFSDLDAAKAWLVGDEQPDAVDTHTNAKTLR